MSIIKIVLVLTIALLTTAKVSSQSKSLNRVEIGCHATYFFDERHFQFGDINKKFPFLFFRSIAYSKSIKSTNSAWQIRFIQFDSKNRELQYEVDKILDKSYLEHYSYLSFYYMYLAKDLSLITNYLILGINYRWGSELYYVNINSFESLVENRISNDFSVSIGFRIESKQLNNFFLYFQPLYNAYFYRQDRDFLKYEIISNVGIGYNFK